MILLVDYQRAQELITLESLIVGMNRWQSNLLLAVRTLVWFLLPWFLGLLVALLMSKIPSAGRLPFIPVNHLVLPVLFVSGIMFWKLMSSFRNSSILLIVTIALILTGTITMYLTSIDGPKGVVFNTTILNYLTVLTYSIAVLPFLWNQKRISFHQKFHEESEYSCHIVSNRFVAFFS